MANTPNLGLEKISAGTKPYYEKQWANLDKIDANNPKHKFDATTAPTVNNDTTEGYSVGSRWADVTNDNLYVCLDATTGAAVWKETTGGGGDTLPIPDTTPIVKGSDDATKQVRIEADGLTTGTTRVITMPDKDITPDDSGDTRPPSNHASNHTDGTDDIQSATNAQKGLATASQITELESNTDAKNYANSPMIVSGGKVTTGSDAGTFKVEALTALLRTTDSLTGELKKVPKNSEDNIAITAADTTYFVCLNYNAGSPTISLSTSNPYEADKRNIPIGKVMKDGSNNVHYLSGGFRFQDGIKKSHQRAKELREIELESGSAIKYLATDKFTMETGVAYSGLNRFPLSAYNSDTTQYTLIRSDGAGGWIETNRNTIDCGHYDNNGTLTEIGNNRYGCHYVHKHVGDEHAYVVLGTGSYTLAEAVTNAVIPPERPSHLDDFGCLIGCIIAPKNGGEFTKVIMITSQFFSGTEVANHANLSNLEYANSGHTGFAKSGANDDITSMTGLTTPLDEIYGGTGMSEQAAGDILYASGANTLARLAKGTAKQILRMNTDATAPEWADGGKVVQVVYTQTGAYACGTTILPLDDTIPQITEGDEYMTRTITPKNASNILYISVVTNFSHSVSDTWVTTALFQDSIANALACANVSIWANNAAPNLHRQTNFNYAMTAGTTSEITFRVRMGGNQAGTTYFNGRTGGRQFGGVFMSSITIMEVAA